MGTGFPPGPVYPPLSTILTGPYLGASNTLLGIAPASSVLLSSTVTDPPKPYRWHYLTRRFNALLANLELTDQQRDDGETKHRGIRSCLNKWYWNTDSDYANSMLIGSWGKGTRVRPSRDIDILFLLPSQVYWQYQDRIGNRQSALLQEIRNVLAQTYSQTKMRADGQVVVVPFNTIEIEVAPGFRCDNGTISVCDTNNGGGYKTSTAEFELAAISVSDTECRGNTRALVRMMKQWQRECKVPLKSFWIERLVIEFMPKCWWRYNDVFYYDYLVRDFFAYLIQRVNGLLSMPGTGEVVSLGNDWLFKARNAYDKALSACDNERDNYQYLAGIDWQAIFGSAIPLSVE